MRPLIALLPLACLASVIFAAGDESPAVPPLPPAVGTQEAERDDPPELLGEGDTCLGCHAALARREIVHEPVETETCQGCHRQPDSLRHAFDPIQDLAASCARCHDPEIRPVAHGPYADGSCLSCHDAHQSDVSALLLAETDLELCLTCHSKPMRRAGGTWMIGLAPVQQPDMHLHGPIQEGDCVSCHEPHASNHGVLLTGRYPERLYADYDEASYGLCFTCHDAEAFSAAESELTGFRDGTRNLHQLHLAVEGKGRSCRACHDPHASREPFLLRGRVPFGGWRYPLAFTQIPGGGRCSPGCHAPEEYQR